MTTNVTLNNNNLDNNINNNIINNNNNNRAGDSIGRGCDQFVGTSGDIRRRNNHIMSEDVHEVATDMQPIEFALTKSIGVILEEKGYYVSKEFVDQLTELTALYFHNFIKSLLDVTQSQRRRVPTLSDFSLILRLRKTHPIDLLKEYYQFNRRLSKTSRDKLKSISVDTIQLLERIQSQDVILDETDESLPFFINENYEIAAILPEKSSKPNYIPSYLPELPPDYTYQNTSDYTKRLNDLKQLRIKLVEESRLTQKSLYGLIDDDENKWKKSIEDQVTQAEVEELIKARTNEDKESTEDEQKPEVVVDDEKNKESEEIEKDSEQEVKIVEPESEDILKDKIIEQSQVEGVPEKKSDEVEEVIVVDGEAKIEEESVKKQPPPPFVFDFEAYAKKRRLISEKKEQRIQAKRQLRGNNIYMKAEQYYSPYATARPTAEINNYFTNILDESFKSVIKQIRIDDSVKQKKIQQLLEQRAIKEKERELEREKQQESMTFQFDNLVSSSDDDDDDDDFPDFSSVPKETAIEKSVSNQESHSPIDEESNNIDTDIISGVPDQEENTETNQENITEDNKEESPEKNLKDDQGDQIEHDNDNVELHSQANEDHDSEQIDSDEFEEELENLLEQNEEPIGSNNSAAPVQADSESDSEMDFEDL
ncbi:uncharacterized protein RJT21DRAFT_5773 [Scheffersomyces amazonensis]|uniref:uncharacterized protein n=1 Tax=Scheffersomyces amazonensis TaxID=1078765 RepID=UPI00315C52BF